MSDYDLPVINSLLDNDFYQFTMSNCVWVNGDGDLPVRYEFRNRTFAVPLAARLDADLLAALIDRVRALRFETNDVEYLRSLGLFADDWLAALPDFRLPEVQIGSHNGHLTLTYEGPWAQAIFWETPLLALVSEVYYKRFGGFYDEGAQRLREKIGYLKDRKTLRFVEFGTRRRHSAQWQEFVLGRILTDIPDLLIGTSNVTFARAFGIRPVGTIAHQMQMIYTAVYHHQDFGGAASRPWASFGGDAFVRGIERTLGIWAGTYGKHEEMMTVLPDTYGTEHFIHSCPPDVIAPFTGFRQDSGIPINIGEMLYTYARILGHERPRLIFSDGLDIRKMSVIDDFFGERADVSFGWGTDLTNDLGFEPLSIVLKPSAVQVFDEWLPCVKISDDIQKATGPPAEVQKYLKELFNHDKTLEVNHSEIS